MSHPVEPDDLEDLARRAAAGERDAFADLCAALHDDVWRYCRALGGDRELAFDATQETFVRLVTAIRRFRGDAPVRPYVLVIARRAVAQAIAQRVRRRHEVPGTVPEVTSSDRTGLVDLADLLDELPRDLREAFALTQVTGLGYAEAAIAAGCPIGTIRSRVHRARERLVTALADADTAGLHPPRPRPARGGAR